MQLVSYAYQNRCNSCCVGVGFSATGANITDQLLSGGRIIQPLQAPIDHSPYFGRVGMCEAPGDARPSMAAKLQGQSQKKTLNLGSAAVAARVSDPDRARVAAAHVCASNAFTSFRKTHCVWFFGLESLVGVRVTQSQTNMCSPWNWGSAARAPSRPGTVFMASA